MTASYPDYIEAALALPPEAGFLDRFTVYVEAGGPPGPPLLISAGLAWMHEQRAAEARSDEPTPIYDEAAAAIEREH